MPKLQQSLRTMFFLVTYFALICGWSRLLQWLSEESWMWCYYPWNLKAKCAVACYFIAYCCLLSSRTTINAWQWGEMGAFLLVLDYVYETSYEGWNNPISYGGGAQYYFYWGFADGAANLTQFVVLTVPLAYFAIGQGRCSERISGWTICSLAICILNASLIFATIYLFHEWKYFR